MKRAGESFKQHGVCTKASEEAGFPQGPHSLNLTSSLFIEASLRQLPLEDGKAKSPHRSVVCGPNAIFNQKDEKMCRLPVQMFGKPARLIFSVPVMGDQMTQSGIPCRKLALSRRCMGPLNQVAKSGGDSLAKPGDHRVLSFGKTCRFAYEMGKTGLLLIHPLAIDSIASLTRIFPQCPINASKACLERLTLILKKAAELGSRNGYVIV